MTWGDFTRKNRNKLGNFNVLNNEILVDIIKPIPEEIYAEYEAALYGNANTEYMREFCEIFIPNNSAEKVDLHGLYVRDAQFVLEYILNNRDKYIFPLSIISGRGSHSFNKPNIDMSVRILSQNYTTGKLEDFVLRWLRQHRVRFTHRLGCFILS